MRYALAVHQVCIGHALALLQLFIRISLTISDLFVSYSEAIHLIFNWLCISYALANQMFYIHTDGKRS